jgi:hypothetical protein
MVTALKLVARLGMHQANRFLAYALSKRAPAKVFDWALREALDALSPSTLDQGERAARDIMPNVGVPPADSLRKRLSARISEFKDGQGLRVSRGLARSDMLAAVTRSIQEQDFRTQTLSQSDFLKPGIFKFLSLVRSEGGYTSKDGNFSYHMVSFQVYGKLEDGTCYHIEGVGYRRDAFR